MTDGLLLGLDIGTTAVKAVALDSAGRTFAEVEQEIPLFTPGPLLAEQDPETWHDATKAVLAELTRKAAGRHTIALGIAGQMHSLVLLDREDRVLRPAILWCDGRTSRECADIEATVGKERLLDWVGNPALPGFTAPKILWVMRREPAVFERCERICLPVSFLVRRLTGVSVMDLSEAAGTCLIDVRTGRWHERLLEAIGIPARLLPPLVSSSEIGGRLSPEAARATGLPEGLPVVPCGADNPVGAIATGIMSKGMASVSLGTSGVVLAFAEEPFVDRGRRLHTFHHALPGAWYLMGVTLSAGFSLRWLRDCLRALAPAASYDAIASLAASAPPGALGLTFLPYLNGERTPHNDPEATGAFIGLTSRHGTAHLARAVFEGVAFSLRDCLDLMRGLGIRPSRVRLTGGGSKNPLWARILADVLDVTVETLADPGGVAHGAAILAGAAAGAIPDLAGFATRRARVASDHAPDPRSRGAYGSALARYRAAYPALASLRQR